MLPWLTKHSGQTKQTASCSWTSWACPITWLSSCAVCLATACLADICLPSVPLSGKCSSTFSMPTRLMRIPLRWSPTPDASCALITPTASRSRRELPGACAIPNCSTSRHSSTTSAKAVAVITRNWAQSMQSSSARITAYQPRTPHSLYGWYKTTF